MALSALKFSTGHVSPAQKYFNQLLKQTKRWLRQQQGSTRRVSEFDEDDIPF